METAWRATQAFALPAPAEKVEPTGAGRIHDSYVVTCPSPAGDVRYLLQHVNDKVFPEPARVMENIARVTLHIARTLGPNADRRVLKLIPTRDNAACFRDERGAYWRMYAFVENTVTHQAVDQPEIAEAAAFAFGTFVRQLADLPEPPLQETLPGFHDTPLRLDTLEAAITADACGRVADAKPEIDAIREHVALARVLAEAYLRGDLPERIVHNDTKINNVLFDAETGEALCVVDLDTVMPGLVHFDFGDMMRTMICQAAEDETDLGRIVVQLPLFEGMARGYLRATNAILTPEERELLVVSGQVITYEQAVRFLTDYLEGDAYYRVDRPAQNLDRCRTQLALLRSMQQNAKEMERIVAEVSDAN